MKNLLLLLTLFIGTTSFAQTAYKDSMRTYLLNYVQQHEVVKGHDKDHMKFYEVDPAYRVVADFMLSTSADWIRFKTSGKQDQVFRLYGTASFILNGNLQKLNIYQSQDLMTNPQYKNYLFLPFRDSTSGNETYSGGRYIDLTTNDIAARKVVLDFNKAYNPYCAYVSGVYNCPVPPKENALPVAIKAGEKAFTNKH
jgi:uncharacterized protein (DUF1684 family)